MLKSKKVAVDEKNRKIRLVTGKTVVETALRWVYLLWNVHGLWYFTYELWIIIYKVNTK